MFYRHAASRVERTERGRSSTSTRARAATEAGFFRMLRTISSAGAFAPHFRTELFYSFFLINISPRVANTALKPLSTTFTSFSYSFFFRTTGFTPLATPQRTTLSSTSPRSRRGTSAPRSRTTAGKQIDDAENNLKQNFQLLRRASYRRTLLRTNQVPSPHDVFWLRAYEQSGVLRAGRAPAREWRKQFNRLRAI